MVDVIDMTSPIAVKPVAAILDDAVARFPDNAAIDMLGRRTSYGELGRLVERAAEGLQGLGVKKGVRVGLCLPNCSYYIIAYFAVLKAGGIVVNYNPLYVERELKHQIEDSGTEIMVTLDLKQIYPKVRALLDQGILKTVIVCPMADALPTVKSVLFKVLKRSELADIPADSRHVAFSRLINNQGRPQEVAILPETDVAVLQYTGGTTGVPKAAMLTHANLSANTDQVCRWYPAAVPGRERMMCVLPFFHVYAMTVAMNMGINVGAELILMPRFQVEEALKIIARRRPTIMPGVPTLYSAVAEAAAKGGYDLTSLRFCLSGGAPLPVEIRKRFEEVTGVSLVEGYGLTESSPVATCNPIGAIKDGSIGKPLPATIVEIRSVEDPGQLVETGVKGEVCLRGPQVMAGYWNKPQETARVFVDGALRTGDVGYIDEEGYIFLVDRIKDLIICGGYNVYPRVIEEALYQHPAVVEATCIGIPDDYRGQAPKCFVRLAEGKNATPAELHDFLSGYLSRIEMPKAIEIRDELPKTMVGKLSKKELLAEELARIAQEKSATGQGGN